MLDPEGNFYYKTILPEINYREIQPVIFIKEWYINPRTVYTGKKVVCIAPVRHYFDMEDVENEISMKTIPFVVYFGETNKW